MMHSVKHFSCSNSYLSSIAACSDYYLVCTVRQNGNLAVWNLQSHEKEPAILIGHHMVVTAIALSYHPSNYLCSCSSDSIILWDLVDNEGHPKRGKVLLSNLSNPAVCCFNYDNTKVIVSCDFQIVIIILSDKRCSLLSVQACPILSLIAGWNSILMTLDDNNFFKVWDLNSYDTVHQKLISPGFPVAVSAEIESRHVAVGTSAGNLVIYSENFSVIREWRAWKLLKDCMNRKQNLGNFLVPSLDFDDDNNFTILDLSIFTFQKEDTELYRFFPLTLGLVVITSSCLFIVNVNREEVCYIIDFKNDTVFDGCYLGLVSSASVRKCSDNNYIRVALSPVAVNTVILLTLCIRNCCDSEVNLCKAVDSLNVNETSQYTSETLSFICSKAVESSSSYLNFKMAKPIQKKSAYAKSINGHSQNKPTTFHSKIKSSGYGIVYSSVMFQSAKTRKLSCSRSRSGLNWSKFSGSHSDFCTKKPNLTSEFLIDGSTNILSAKLSVDGQYALCASNNGIVEMLQLSKRELKIVKSINCHNTAVTCVNWSHSGQLWVTVGSDKTVKLWSSSTKNQEPVLTFSSNCINKIRKDLRHFEPKENPSFEDDIALAQFYYIDQFVLLSSRNVLYMYGYDIHSKKTDLKRYNNHSQSKMVVKVPLNCQRITAFAAVNQFYSNLVICSGTAKYLDVLDMNTAKVVWSAAAISGKPPYTICLNEGCANMQQASRMYDIFFTASLGDSIKLWDLRTKQPIMNYCEHCCRTVKCGVSFSSCGRYIAAGSEDKSIFIYDLRSTSSLYKLSNHSDVITSVSFSPLGTQLLASSLNGTMYLYGSGIA